MTIASGQEVPEGNVVDPTYVYWTNRGNGATIMSAPK